MANEVKDRAERPAPPKSVAAPMPSRRRNRRRGLLPTLLILVLLAAVVFLGVKYYQTRQDAKKLSNPQTAAAQQTTDLVTAVAKLVELPAGQTPTIATVTDINKLKGQAFFINAQNGDKVLIYTQAKKAILYRPSTNKVIEIAPVNLGSGQTTPASSQNGTTQTKQ